MLWRAMVTHVLKGHQTREREFSNLLTVAPRYTLCVRIRKHTHLFQPIFFLTLIYISEGNSTIFLFCLRFLHLIVLASLYPSYQLRSNFLFLSKIENLYFFVFLPVPLFFKKKKKNGNLAFPNLSLLSLSAVLHDSPKQTIFQPGTTITTICCQNTR